MRVLSNIAYIVIVCGVLCSLGQVSHAQEYDSVDAPVKFQPIAFDIPPQAATAAFIQDKDGFFWIGTQIGLVKWDGMHATFYNKANSGISDPFITKILQSQDGLFWFGTLSGGLNKYDKETNTFTQYHHDPGNPQSLSSDAIGTLLYGQSIIEDHEGFLWIGTTAGLNRFDPMTEQFTRYQHDPTHNNSLSHNEVLAMYEDSAGILWIGTQNGLNRFDTISQTFRHYFHDPQEVDSLSHNQVQAIVEDHEGVLWVGTDAGLDRLDKADDTFTRYQYKPDDPNSLANPTVSCIIETKAGELWLAHSPDGKVTRFNKARNHFTRYQNDPQDSRSLPEDDVKTLYQDRFGVMWFMALSGGVSKYDPRPPKFRLYEREPNNPAMLNSTTHGVVEDHEGLVWFTTDTGFSKYDPQTNSFTAIDVSDTGPYVMLIDSADQMWVGERTGNLVLFDRQAERYVQTYPLGAAYVTGIKEDNGNPNILWITTHDAGLVKFHKQTEDWTYYQHDDNDPHSISSNSVWSSYQEDDLLWLGTAGGGLNKFDKTTEIFTSFLHSEDQPETISHNIVDGIVYTSAGELWLATLGGGLNKLDEQRGTFEHYNQVEGTFPTDMVGSILEDKTGHLWIEAVVEGLTSYIKFHPESKTYRVYGADDGVQTGTSWAVGYHQAKDGEIWYTGTEGVNAFYPEQIKENDFIPPVYLTALRQGGEDLIVDKALEKLEEMTLDWHNNFFEFEYVALNYTHPENNQYAYMMEGLDKEWYFAKTRRFGRYVNIPPGEYTLRIKGSNNDGVWNEEGVSLTIRITPPFWETVWFRGLVTALMLGSVFGGIRWRFSTIKAQRRRLEVQVAERTRDLHVAKKQAEVAQQAAEAANQAKSEFLSNMSHELRTPLNGILGYAHLLKRGKELSPFQVNGLNIIQQSGKHLLTLINDILDLSKIEAGKMELYRSDVHLSSFLQGIVGIIRMRAQQKDLACTYEAPSPLPPGVQADEQRLRQVLLNLLGNAVKFTERGNVTFQVTNVKEPTPAPSQEGNSNLCTEQKFPSWEGAGVGFQSSLVTLHFSISDTGVGMSPDQLEMIFLPFEQVGDIRQRAAGTGLGLAISRQLVHLMGSELHVDSEVGRGSRFWFELELPVVATATEAAPDVERPISGYTGEQRTILVVDDKTYNRSLIVDTLEPLGFRCIEALNGRELVEKANERRPDLILTDLVMPVMTGFEAAQEIRQNPDIRHIPIIAMTASVFEMDQEQSRLAGCDGFLPKPVEIPKLFAFLETFLHVEWMYEERSQATAPGTEETRASEEMPLIPPPPEEMDVLYELLMLGNLSGLQERADTLERLDAKFRPFARKLSQLAAAYQDDQLLAFVKQYRGEKK